MDIETPLRELGEIDATGLREAILNQEEAAWHEDTYRQQSYDVHDQSESIVLVFTDGENWLESDVKKEPGWDRIADVAVPVMHEIIDKRYPAGGPIICAMAAKLLAGGKIKLHHDKRASFHCGHRIHIRSMAEALGHQPTARKYSPDMSKHACQGIDENIPDYYRKLGEMYE